MPTLEMQLHGECHVMNFSMRSKLRPKAKEMRAWPKPNLSQGAICSSREFSNVGQLQGGLRSGSFKLCWAQIDSPK